MRAKDFTTNVWLVGIALSVALHAATFGTIASRSRLVKEKRDPVKVKIVEVKPEEPKKEEIPPPPPPPAPPKPKKKPEKKKPEVASERQPPKEPPKEAVKPIQGLNKDSLAKDGKGMAAPVGNTLMVEDTGERVKDAEALNADLTADAKLVPGSVPKPPYTPAAVDANFEGYVIVDVFVDEQGVVKEAELKKKVGYGMDQGIIDAARKARFTPRKNRFGKSEASWSQITFNMQLP